MKTQIRRSVFETNSSSTHSISIVREQTNIHFPTTLEFNVGDATAVKISVNNQVIDFEPSTPHQYIKINIKTE